MRNVFVIFTACQKGPSELEWKAILLYDLARAFRKAGVDMYNLLTLQLLYEGYTAKNYPDFVKIPSGILPGDNPLNNIYGGFEFQRNYLDDMVFKTPCGKYVKGRNIIDNMHFYISWQAENYNPVIRCPYAVKKGFSCNKMHPILQGKDASSDNFHGMQFCSCNVSDEAYEYENSIEKENDDRQCHMEFKFQEFSEKKNGHVCRNHCRYDEFKDEWEMRYSPELCVHRCYSSFCPVRGRELDSKKANVYYDILTKGIYDRGFIDEEWERVEKGVRFFDKPVSRDICEAFVKLESDVIAKRYQQNHGRDFLADKSFSFEILNIRVESRPHRDLEADLRDIEEGRCISWAPEENKRKREEKKVRRKQAAAKRLEKLEKKILSNGFDSLNEGDKYRAEKLLSCERIDELNTRYQEERSKAVQVQLSLFDF